MTNDVNTCVIIAGATGLVGSKVVENLIAQSGISHLYSLSRRPLKDIYDPTNKIIPIIDAELTIHQWNENQTTPDIGFICLGTTLKQAGSKENLRKVDVELVTSVAQQMKMVGVKRLAVVSSLGANRSSPSHYLACKGQMEQNIEKMGFDEMVFVRPGPLVGERDHPRSDEKLVQALFKVIRPLMIGKLSNFLPIKAEEVAKAMIYQVYSYQENSVVYLQRKEMLDLLHHYD
ncbi:NAD(P)H-binding protein [Vibrio parahaemolyticus]|uniref:NAD(P)H-binding protein n=1 Tax=Vibrio parahaemolyticus TaxID=670 RepID=UPI0004D37222|nr:NAD(P)H-binding protein [Vibrio parahaemolyticus]EGQ7877400.1 NAD(P)H-binding protein [Vibrio parahaemolyticus]EGR0225105.1 NAD-dependent epimerase/dehydratase family protein [Vibrio parahaemolyticus]EGR1360815.1 NAD-dependent epimerase/dehydratase family protein [Vibrio parahaemolyticus]EGR3365177.1 nucleoside-diphosphate sugar epimerase [Vibrio parahaemolyticus]EGR9057188.1 NAD(P)H-binding protein [Vibrio parahaemolyticus]